MSITLKPKKVIPKHSLAYLLPIWLRPDAMLMRLLVLDTKTKAHWSRYNLMAPIFLLALQLQVNILPDFDHELHEPHMEDILKRKGPAPLGVSASTSLFIFFSCFLSDPLAFTESKKRLPY
jgi:hypothetical protein